MMERTIHIPSNEDAVPMIRTAAFERPADVPAQKSEPAAPTYNGRSLEQANAEAEAAKKQEETEFSKTVEAEFIERNAREKDSAVTTLRAKWGDAYDDRLSEIDKTLATTGLADAVRSARLPNGSMLLNNPQVLETMWRLAQINAYRRENRSEYNRSERMQGEERALISRIASMIGAE